VRGRQGRVALTLPKSSPVRLNSRKTLGMCACTQCPRRSVTLLPHPTMGHPIPEEFRDYSSSPPAYPCLDLLIGLLVTQSLPLTALHPARPIPDFCLCFSSGALRLHHLITARGLCPCRPLTLSLTGEDFGRVRATASPTILRVLGDR
jgi:hypothetical protein